MRLREIVQTSKQKWKNLAKFVSCHGCTHRRKSSNPFHCLCLMSVKSLEDFAIHKCRRCRHPGLSQHHRKLSSGLKSLMTSALWKSPSSLAPRCPVKTGAVKRCAACFILFGRFTIHCDERKALRTWHPVLPRTNDPCSSGKKR